MFPPLTEEHAHGQLDLESDNEHEIQARRHEDRNNCRIKGLDGAVALEVIDEGEDRKGRGDEKAEDRHADGGRHQHQIALGDLQDAAFGEIRLIGLGVALPVPEALDQKHQGAHPHDHEGDVGQKARARLQKLFGHFCLGLDEYKPDERPRKPDNTGDRVTFQFQSKVSFPI